MRIVVVRVVSMDLMSLAALAVVALRLLLQRVVVVVRWALTLVRRVRMSPARPGC